MAAIMKTEIHPKSFIAIARCACGSEFQTTATRELLKVDMCSNCHPFFTGKQRLLDAAGRVERFGKRFAKTEGKTVAREKTVQKRIAVAPPKVKASAVVLTTTPKNSKAPKTKDAAKDKKTAH